MQPIQDSRISYDGETYSANCVKCQRKINSRFKSSVCRTLANGYCRKCNDRKDETEVSKNDRGKWISHCPKCGDEQEYTRRDHAKSSERQGWVCVKCRESTKSIRVGSEKRLYNKFRKSANNRGIAWDITFEDFVGCYKGKCALTGWELNMDYGTCTASFDRIDSSKPYEVGNIQWVHTMVNMAKNKYPQEKFIEMCCAIADKVKW